MSVQKNQEFQDPALKEAICRCWSCDCASEHLRKRVAAMLAQDKRVGVTARRPSPMRSWVLWPLAAAAALAISVALFDRYRSNPSTGSATGLVASAIPVELENDLIRTHDHCCKLKNHQELSAPKNDDVAIADLLRARLKQPVLVYHPADANWKFLGAAVCRVGAVPSGHLVFIKGDDALSIFSLPKSLLPTAVEGSQFSANVDGHPMVGFVKDGALFCVVSSGPAGTVSVDELQQMSQQMKPAVADGPAVVPTGVVLTELLRPIR